MNNRPEKPKFAEAMTQVRHANTVIRRLSSVSGLRTLPPPDEPFMPEPADRTDLRDHLGGFGENVLIAHEPATDPGIPAARPLPPVSTKLTAPEAPRPVAQPFTAPRTVSEGSIVAQPLEPAADAAEVQGEIIVVFGCRGGAGATTVAVNLGAGLARSARGAVIVDLDLQMGDVLCALDLQPTATIAEVLVEIDELDVASSRRRLTEHRSGLFVLSQGDRFDQLEQLRPERIPALIAGLSRQFGAVVIDGLRDFSDLSISALDMADKIILVVPEDVAGVKNASRCLEVFRRLGYGEAKLAMVVNRHDGKAKVTPSAIADTLRLQPLAVLPTDARTAQDALDEGRLLAEQSPRSPLAAAIAGLAAQIDHDERRPGVATRRGGLFGKLRMLFGGGKR